MLGTWWLAQLMAHHFGSPSTHVQGAPKLNGHLAGQQSPGDKVMALDQVRGWTDHLNIRGDDGGTCFGMLCDGNEQVENVVVGDEALRCSASILVKLGQDSLGKQQLDDPHQHLMPTVLQSIS